MNSSQAKPQALDLKYIFRLIIQSAVDSRHLAAPPDPVQLAHLHNVIMGPVEVIGQKCRFLVDFVCRIRLY